MRQRAQQQTKTNRGVAGCEEQMPPPRLPDLADPAGCSLRAPALHRQHVTCRRAEVALERAQDAIALDRIVDLGIARIDVLG
jgi:hypothetical protein